MAQASQLAVDLSRSCDRIAELMEQARSARESVSDSLVRPWVWLRARFCLFSAEQLPLSWHPCTFPSASQASEARRWRRSDLVGSYERDHFFKKKSLWSTWVEMAVQARTAAGPSELQSRG